MLCSTKKGSVIDEAMSVNVNIQSLNEVGRGVKSGICLINYFRVVIILLK